MSAVRSRGSSVQLCEMNAAKVDSPTVPDTNGSEDDIWQPAIFHEPDGYYKQPDPARWVDHTLLSGDVLRLRLVQQGPMWVGRAKSSCDILSIQENV